jgi:hypothetical protein
MIPSNDTITTLCFLHPLVIIDLPPFVNDFHLQTKVILNRKTFIFTLAHSPHLSSSGPSSMVYELLQDYSIPKDSTNGFDLFFEYVDTLFMVMFPHLCCFSLWHHAY